MAHLRHSNRAYISQRLKEGLNGLEYKRYNYICAPTGYGKSFVCSTFFKSYSGRSVLWIDADTTKDAFWSGLCAALKLIDPTYSHELLSIGFPHTDEDVRRISYILDMFPSKESEYLIIIDNFDKLQTDILCQIFSGNCIKSSLGISFIFLIESLVNHKIINLITKSKAGFIGTELLSFNVDDIKDYYRLKELIITAEEALAVYNKTYGWPYAVKLYADYHDKPDNYISNMLDSFIYTNIWLDSTDNMKKFLLDMSVFDWFTLTQCSIQTGMNEADCYNQLMGLGLIRYDEDRQRYSFNPVLKHFIKNILNNETVSSIYDITLCTANTYKSTGNCYEAIRLYARAGHYQEIYDYEVTLKQLYSQITKANKDIFFDIANHYWSVEKNGYYDFAIIICFIMFLYNERQTASKLISDINKDISKDSAVGEKKLIDYEAALTYISAFLEYNNFESMNALFLDAAKLTQKPLELVAGQFPFIFECPSVMSLYHSGVGELDCETAMLEACAPNYYRITNGHGKGFEALMKAEVLYNRGDIEGAQILCHKAVYMADGRNQYSIYIAATFLMTLIAVYKGANDEFNEHIRHLTNITEGDVQADRHIQKIADICKSYIYSNLSKTEYMSDWLKSYRQLEQSVNFHTLGFANIILGKYLILTRDYHKFLGISGQLLGLNHIYSYITANIYTYIYLSIANNETGEKEKSHGFLLEAVNLAYPDGLYMPFVHNYTYICSLLTQISETADSDILLFIKNVQRLAKPYEKGVKAINKAGRLLADYGLTVREADVAKLAAKRLTNREIAEQLFIAESTVKSNMKVIFNKLQINSRAELKNFFD